jgi:hypothetical protein
LVKCYTIINNKKINNYNELYNIYSVYETNDILPANKAIIIQPALTNYTNKLYLHTIPSKYHYLLKKIQSI